MKTHATAKYTLQDFLHGRPERLIQATKFPKILVTWPHGNEESGPRLGHHIYTQRPDLLEHVDYVCGNPRAAADTLNYVETDLNRAFNPPHKPTSYEEIRAVEIAALMKEYDYVIAMHTSVTDIGQFVITGEITPARREIIAASGFDRVVVMPPSIIDESISGLAPNALEFEMNEKIAELPETIESFVTLIETLIKPGHPHQPRPREFFYVENHISKAADPGVHVPNFKLYEAGGYYPLLMGVGKHSYRDNPAKDYVGYAATRRDVITI
jgi:hypothetical protein